jgi:LmbE family N-acetylglucosaminyl deacetylase
MGRVFLYPPHPDDDVLSMGLAFMHYIYSGFETHMVSMTNGDALGVANTLNGSANGSPILCTSPADHPYVHNPAREQYEPLTTDAIGVARLDEARSVLGAMAMMAPVTGSNGTPITPGQVFHHYGGLHDGFGAPGQGSSTAPVTREGIDAAKAVMLPFIQDNPNSFHITMSPADHHHDHAACGIALREIKQENPTLLGTPMFMISRLYWTVTNGLYAADLRAAAGGTTGDPNGSIDWFAPFTTANYNLYVAHLRNKVIGRYRTWNPAAGSYGVGYHQVAAQFEANFGAAASVANLFHI